MGTAGERALNPAGGESVAPNRRLLVFASYRFAVTDLVFLPATKQAQLIASGELSSRELVDAHLNQIESVNPSVNAIVTLTAERAQAAAAASDNALVAGQALGPLHGLPIVHKDLVMTKGIRTTSGSPIFADQVPQSDALLVRRERAAGAITLGKTNTPRVRGRQPDLQRGVRCDSESI